MIVSDDELWVVFDGTEPDSKVIGLAASLEGVIEAIQATVEIDRQTVVIEWPFTDAGTVKAEAAPLYSQGLDKGKRAWSIQKESVRA